MPRSVEAGRARGIGEPGELLVAEGCRARRLGRVVAVDVDDHGRLSDVCARPKCYDAIVVVNHANATQRTVRKGPGYETADYEILPRKPVGGPAYAFTFDEKARLVRAFFILHEGHNT